MSYVVKLKYKEDGAEPCYANKNIVHSVKEIRNNGAYSIDWFLLKLDDARKLVTDLISRSNEPPQSWGWGGSPQKKLDFIAIVELSNYDSKREYEVVDYKEFK